jgi:hypothetical protein
MQTRSGDIRSAVAAGASGASVEVAHRIEAPANVIFEIVANPQDHTESDGSDMLRNAGQPSDRKALAISSS